MESTVAGECSEFAQSRHTLVHMNRVHLAVSRPHRDFENETACPGSNGIGICSSARELVSASTNFHLRSNATGFVSGSLMVSCITQRYGVITAQALLGRDGNVFNSLASTFRTEMQSAIVKLWRTMEAHRSARKLANSSRIERISLL